MPELIRSSTLRARAADVWRHAVSPDGVNRELRPLLRMTFPPDTRDLTASFQPGERLFRSWLLLFGVLPVEFDDVVFVELEPGRRFLERSSLFTQRKSAVRMARMITSRTTDSAAPPGQFWDVSNSNTMACEISRLLPPPSSCGTT